MDNQYLNLLDYYKQSKQRVDIDIDFQRKKIIGKTNLTFLLKDENKTIKHPELLNLKLNAENMIIKSISIVLYNKCFININSYQNVNNIDKQYSTIINDNNKENNNEFLNNNVISIANPNLKFTKNLDSYANPKNIANIDQNIPNMETKYDNDCKEKSSKSVKNLKYAYINPENYIEYLNNLYLNVEDSESIKNLNRIEWEQKFEGSLLIDIPFSYLLKSTKVEYPEEVINEKNINKLQDKFKIIIEYELYANYSGIIFQNFYDEKIDSDYDVCYTPNFVKRKYNLNF